MSNNNAMNPEKLEASVRSENEPFLFLQSKTKSLEEMLRLHRFYNSCQEFESWMEDKENILNTFNSNSDNLGVIQAKYEVKKQNKNLNYYMLIWMSYFVCWSQRFAKHLMENASYKFLLFISKQKHKTLVSVPELSDSVGEWAWPVR